MRNWEQQTFIDGLSYGAVEKFLNTHAEEELILKNFGSIERCVEVMAEQLSKDNIVEDCVDEIYARLLKKLAEARQIEWLEFI